MDGRLLNYARDLLSGKAVGYRFGDAEPTLSFAPGNTVNDHGYSGR